MFDRLLGIPKDESLGLTPDELNDYKRLGALMRLIAFTLGVLTPLAYIVGGGAAVGEVFVLFGVLSLMFAFKRDRMRLAARRRGRLP